MMILQQLKELRGSFKMKFETDKNIITCKVEELGAMATYLAWDSATKEQYILIKKFDEAIVLQKASNCDELVTLGIGLDKEVNVIGKVWNMDILNIKTSDDIKVRGRL